MKIRACKVLITACIVMSTSIFAQQSTTQLLCHSNSVASFVTSSGSNASSCSQIPKENCDNYYMKDLESNHNCKKSFHYNSCEMLSQSCLVRPPSK